MKAHGVGASTFSDWWAYKYEVNDAIPHNASILNSMGVITAINSDDAEMSRRLNQEAAKALAAGNRAGFNISKARAMRWITSNPAKAAGIEETTGSLVKGKNADVVIWNKNPFSVYAIAQKVFIDGNLMFDRQDLSSKPVSDLGWRSHGEHVGQTGKPVAANLYIAIGISGAIQHIAGINSSKVKVVINTDPEAPFFKAADYGIVGDAFEVVPKLIEEIKQLRS